MPRPKNEVIGEVECPQKGCTAKCKVYRFRQRGEAVRFAGKLYADCAVHGRYGADGKQAAQEYILENATIWGDAKQPKSTGAEPVPNDIPSGPPKPVVATPAGPVQRPVPVPTAPVKVPAAGWMESLNRLFK